MRQIPGPVAGLLDILLALVQQGIHFAGQRPDLGRKIVADTQAVPGPDAGHPLSHRVERAQPHKDLGHPGQHQEQRKHKRKREQVFAEILGALLQLRGVHGDSHPDGRAAKPRRKLHLAFHDKQCAVARSGQVMNVNGPVREMVGGQIQREIPQRPGPQLLCVCFDLPVKPAKGRDETRIRRCRSDLQIACFTSFDTGENLVELNRERVNGTPFHMRCEQQAQPPEGQHQRHRYRQRGSREKPKAQRACFHPLSSAASRKYPNPRLVPMMPAPSLRRSRVRIASSALASRASSSP